MPAASQACSTEEPFGTSTSMPSMVSFAITCSSGSVGALSERRKRFARAAANRMVAVADAPRIDSFMRLLRRQRTVLRALYEAIRSSISGRKWRIRPWTGHAAASPSAQIV